MRKILTLISLGVAATSALAQGGSYSSRGQGYVVYDGEKTTFNSVTVNLNRGGDLDVSFSGPNGNVRLDGRWRGTGIRVTIDIDGGAYGSLSGDGAISFFSDRRGLRGISYNGRARGGRELKISYMDNAGELGSTESGNGRPGWGDNSYTAPSWAVGEFSGHNRAYNADITLNVERNGNARATIRFDDGRRQTQTGRLRDGRLTLDGVNFNVRQSGNGFTAEQVNDRSNWTEYRRSSASGGGNDQGDVDVPSWLEGTFAGRNPVYDAQVELTFRNNGRVTTHIRYRDGRTQNQTGSYRNGVVTIEGVRFNVSKTWNGIRVEQQNDRENRVDYKRV